MASRTLGIIRRKSLSEVAEGWDDCFITYRPATLGELKELKALKADELTEEQGLDFILDFIKQHTVSGQIKLVGEAGALDDAALQADDVDSLPQDVITGLFADMTGAKLDPKGTAPTAMTQP